MYDIVTTATARVLRLTANLITPKRDQKSCCALYYPQAFIGLPAMILYSPLVWLTMIIHFHDILDRGVAEKDPEILCYKRRYSV